MWMKMGLGSQELCSPLVVGTAMPTGSWTVATGTILALKRPMTWAAELLFMPPIETAILEALSTVRHQCSHHQDLGWEAAFESGRLGNAEWQGGGGQSQKRDFEVPVRRALSVCVAVAFNIISLTGTC